MNAVAIDAHGYLGVAFGEKLSVDARLVLVQLVRAQRWIVLTHESRVGMATAAKLGNIFAFNLPTKSCCFAHGIHVRLARIAAVATRASQSLLRMDVVRELLLGNLQRRIKRAVAG